jgi:ribosomal protein S21
MACRVESREVSANASWQEKEAAFRKMFIQFKRSVADAGILHEYKKHEYYESPGQKRRRKRKESENQRLKNKLRESFPERSGKKDSSNKGDK